MDGYIMRLRILTWNISFGHGPGSDGLNGEYHPRPESHYDAAIERMAGVLREEQIDIAFLQEVDFDARRSHHRNQLELLSRKSGLLHRSALITWNCPWVPYPGLDPRTQFGSIRSGGGILSRFPIRPLQSDLLPKPRENGRIYNFFYLHRFLQMVEIEGLRLCNLHLEAFSKDNRSLHLVRLADRLRDFDLDLAGGDLNGEAPAPEALPADLNRGWEAPLLPGPTFPAGNASLFIDRFIVKKGRFRDVVLRVPDTGTVSDHLPVLFEGSFERA